MYQTTIEPRVSETDGVGHINNTVVPVWLEAGRNPIFKLFTPDDNFSNWKMIIINMNIDFKSQIYFGRDVEILTWVEKLGNTSLTLYEEIWQSDTLCAAGYTTYVNFNVEKQAAERIPDDIRSDLEEHLRDVSQGDTP
ncbi:thioesterase family protein [Halobacillus sp. A5]|uniref:acyl-CoA thioesterase n=1 Tax=Halobacillus sp. A5 TaxID=2880263 RepID=UPI0020A67446|nr:thioesterase family protein [Halobacillus sp. A5]MCP3027126.1 acyl-CoA thioesterase [Halobacillus sp. A5]